MKKLLICASLLPLFGVTAEAITVINDTDSPNIRFGVRVEDDGNTHNVACDPVSLNAKESGSCVVAEIVDHQMLEKGRLEITVQEGIKRPVRCHRVPAVAHESNQIPLVKGTGTEVDEKTTATVSKDEDGYFCNMTKKS